MTLDDILSALNPAQAEAVRTIEGPVLVLAGAGTGKTRVITYRIAYMLKKGIEPEAILGMTFTNKAAREMRERLAELAGKELAEKVTLGTFHSFCVKVLRKHISLLGYLPSFTIADDADQQGLFKQSAASLGYTGDNFPLNEMINVIGSWKNRLLGPSDASAAADNEFLSYAANLYREYQNLLELQNTVDFDDMLYLTYKLFHLHPEVLERYRDRYRYLLIDEYQDTNDAQFTIVKMLAEKSGNLCVVGDDDQSIYSWRGANIDNIINFPNLFSGCKVIKLEQNYRSTENILAAANNVIGKNTRRHAKKLWSELGSGDKVVLSHAYDGSAEAELIASLITQEMADNPKLRYSDCAVLYRSNHLSRELEMALRKSGLPYRLVGGQEFYKRKEIKDAASYLKILVNPYDDQCLLRVLNTPPRALAEKAVSELKKLRREKHKPMSLLLDDPDFLAAMTGKAAASAKEFAATGGKFRAIFVAGKQSGSLSGQVTAYLREIGYLDGLQKIYKDIKDSQKRQENVYEFINSVAQYEQKNPDSSLSDFLESFALLEENDKVEESESTGDAVTLSTVHAAKGLEYKVVFVVALERGIFPHERSIEEGSVDEEMRLFYVAITRARQKLYLLRSANRLQRGFIRTQMPSPFLGLLDSEVCEKVAADELVKIADKEEMQNAFSDIFELLKKRKACKK